MKLRPLPGDVYPADKLTAYVTDDANTGYFASISPPELFDAMRNPPDHRCFANIRMVNYGLAATDSEVIDFSNRL